MRRILRTFVILLLGLAAAVAARTTRAAPATGGADADRPIRALLICGGCCHDYAHQKDLITKGVSARANVEWTIAYDPDTSTKHLNPVYHNKDWFKGFDVIVHDECSADVKDLDVINNTILAPHKDGLPAVVLHCGMHCYRSEGWPKQLTPWFEFTGLQTTGHGAQTPIELTFLDKDNEITKGMQDWTTIKEELYNNIAMKVLPTAHPLIRGKQPANQRGKDGFDNDTIVTWTNEYGDKKTKVFATTLGHNNETVGDERYLDLIARGLLWSVGKLDAQHLKPTKRVLIDEQQGASVAPGAAGAPQASSAVAAKPREKAANAKKGEASAPVDAARILASVRGPEGFGLTVFAMPPEVSYVTCLAAAPNGEVFIGIDKDGWLGHDPNAGRIVRGMDTKDDGHADRLVSGVAGQREVRRCFLPGGG